jgi:hypothetical protein
VQQRVPREFGEQQAGVVGVQTEAGEVVAESVMSEGTSTPANFVEPAPVIVLAGGTELSVPLVSSWL